MMAHKLVERQARNIQGLKEGGDALVCEPLELVLEEGGRDRRQRQFDTTGDRLLSEGGKNQVRRVP